MPHLPTPALEPVFDLTVTVATPIEAGAITGLNSRGRRRIIPITGGTVRGRLNGAVLPGGAHPTVLNDASGQGLREVLLFLREMQLAAEQLRRRF